MLRILGLIVFVVICYPVSQGTNGLALAAAVGFFAGLLALYFAPIVVAHSRRHPNRTPITIVTLFLGWTLIGWVAALAWAYSAGGDHVTAHVGQKA